MTADTATTDAFAAGQREAREADRVALVTALGMDPATTWEGVIQAVLPEINPGDCQSCSEGAYPCAAHARDWRYWQARAYDAEETVASAEEEGRRTGLEEAAALLDGDGFDPWPAVKRTVNVDAMDQRARNGLDAITDAVIADACREIRGLSVSPESAASRYSAASDAGIAREGASEPIPTTIYDVEGDL